MTKVEFLEICLGQKRFGYVNQLGQYLGHDVAVSLPVERKVPWISESYFAIYIAQEFPCGNKP